MKKEKRKKGHGPRHQSLKLHELIWFICCLLLIVPLMYVMAATQTVVGVVFAVFLGLVIVFFLPLFLKLGREGERAVEVRRMEEVKHQNRMSKICRNLTNLSSVVVKCPKCQWVFLRVDTFKAELKSGSDLHFKYAQRYKNGQLSSYDFEEIFRKSLRQSGYPSSFNCPKCRKVIVRSREPSGICKVNSERVSGERLLDCTLGECHLAE